MIPFKKSHALLLILVTLIVSPAFAQPFLGVDPWPESERAKNVRQDNEYVVNDKAVDNYFYNPLVLDGKALDYNKFSIQTSGELTLIKGLSATGKVIQIPFYVYLRRNGTIVNVPGEERSKVKYMKIEISTILEHAREGDHLIIEPANEEDWQAKRILKLLDGDC